MGSVDQTPVSLDVLILGAGLSGLCSLHHIRQRFPEWRTRVVEAAPDVGGTWYWNRYPGARFDSESVSYQFSFDKDILNEWDWKEAYATQAETLSYISYVAERKDLRRDIQFNTQIKYAEWRDDSRTWLLRDQHGCQYVTRFFVGCIGVLSSPTLPAVEGVETFAGPSFHTSRWPADFDMKREFSGRRIGVVGTGATGIQVATTTANHPDIKSLHVFQRTATWCAPLRNTPITPDQMTKLRRGYDAMFKLCSETPMGFLYKADPRRTADVSEQDRLDLWERLYSQPGFGKWLGVFSDTYTDREANALYSRFMADKIRARVDDPEVAEALIPKTHGFGTRRVPMETGYFEIFNRPNVHLVDLQKTPVERITPGGVVTADGKEHELDVIVYATGFNAITGAWSDIEWHAREDRPLIALSDTPAGERAIWPDHRPRTFMGITAPYMPNVLMVLGPHQPVGNAPRNIEHSVQLVCDLLQHCHDNSYTYVEPTHEGVCDWTEHVFECGKAALSNEVDSWMTGVNKNVKGRSERTVVRYGGSAIEYRKLCREREKDGWRGLRFD